MATASRPRKTRSDKGVKRGTKATRTPPPPVVPVSDHPFTITKHAGETVYSVSLSDAIPLIKHGVSIEDLTGALFSSRPEFCCGGSSLTPARCLDMLERGWTTDRPSLDLPLGEVSQAQTFSLDTQGAYPDVAEYLSGAPECMAEYTTSPAAPRFLHLVVNTTVHANVSNDKLFKRGKYILSLIDSLESQGIRVKLTVLDSNSRYSHSTVAIGIKDYQDPMDEALLCYVLGHPSFFRLCQFALADAMYHKCGLVHGLRIDDYSRGSCKNSYAFPSSSDTLYLAWGEQSAWENSVNSWLSAHGQ